MTTRELIAPGDSYARLARSASNNTDPLLNSYRRLILRRGIVC